MQLILVTILFAFISKPSFAYIDPGSMSIILQILGSAFVGIVVFYRSLKQYIINIYYSIFSKKK
jgi:hypothetical protein